MNGQVYNRQKRRGEKMKINMPAQAAKVIKTLEQHGFEAYIVGGCVRDSILGRTPGDWDITTSREQF